MVRPSYRANLAGDGGKPFFGLIFDPSQQGKADPDDLRGGARAPRRFIGWQTFFDFGDGAVKRNKRSTRKLSTPLLELPRSAIATHDDATAPRSLPQRTLLRHLTWELPSGQRIAGAMGLPALSPSDLAEYADFGVGLERSTPLFLYVLKEAEIVEHGLRLGPVGGRIVAEVIIGLLQSDPGSYLSAQPGWQPTLPGGAGFRMTDFLAFARGRPEEPRPVSRATAPALLRSAVGGRLSAVFLSEMKTWNAKPREIERRWYVVDAEGKTLGRLSTAIADTLRGKRKPQYTPHVDTGDFVVVVNAEKIGVTGKKLDDKMYYRHPAIRAA